MSDNTASQLMMDTLESRMLFALSSGTFDRFGLPVIEWFGETVNAVPGEYVVRLRDDLETPATRTEHFLKKLAGTEDMPVASPAIQKLMRELPLAFSFAGYVGSKGSFALRTSTNLDPTATAHLVKANPNVYSIEPNLLGTLGSPLVPTPNNNGSGDWWRTHVGVQGVGTALGAWDYSTGSSSTVIALIDSGLDILVKDGSTGTGGLPNYAVKRNTWTASNSVQGSNPLNVHPDLRGNLFHKFANDDFDQGDMDDGIGYDWYGDDGQQALTTGDNSPDNNPTGDPNTPHGTVVAGILAADGSDGQGVAGVSWRSKVMPLKISHTWGGANHGVVGTYEKVSAIATTDALSYVNVLNSQGYNIRVVTGAWRIFGAPEGDVTPAILGALKSEIEEAEIRGILVINAAQNDEPAKGHPNDLDSITLESKKSYPAAWKKPNVIVVGATQNTLNEIAKIGDGPIGATGTGTNQSFDSNYGKTQVQIAAPGLSIESTFMRTLHKKNPTDSTATVTTDPDEFAKTIEFGTSLAMPMVAGTAALMLSIKPDLTLQEQRDGILNNATLVSSLGTYIAGTTTKGRLLNAAASVKAVLDAASFSKTVIGDEGGNPFNDVFEVYKSNANDPNSQTIIKRNYQPYATVSATTKIGIFGLAGDDDVRIGPNVNNAMYINGGKGNDTLRGAGGNDTIIGDVGDDTIYGASGADSIDGSAGNDFIDGGASSDTIIGGLGDDVIYGGTEADTLYGYEGADKLYGDDGGDVLYGDKLTSLPSGYGNDTLDGGGGNDTLYGGEGSDQLIGGIGGDSLRGGSGDDSLYAYFVSSGNGGDGYIDKLFGESGSDSAWYNLAEGDSYVG